MEPSDEFRAIIAKAADRLAMIWIAVSVGYVLLADAYDWPLPGFLDYLAAHGAGPRLLFVLVTVAPSIALLLASERLAPDLASDYDLRRFLIKSRRCIQKEIAARRSSASADWMAARSG